MPLQFFCNGTGTNLSQLSEKLPWQYLLFLGREQPVEFVHVVVVNEIGRRIPVATADAVQKTGRQFPNQEVGRVTVGVVCVTDSLGGGWHETALAVELDVTAHGDTSGAHLAGTFQGVVQQHLAKTLALHVGANADRRRHR